MLTFDQFRPRFQEEFCPDYPEPIEPATGLFDELGLDSFDAFRMILFLETLSDIDFPPDDIPPMFTADDAYGYYRLLVHLQADQSG